jgi:hypothetical protein
VEIKEKIVKRSKERMERERGEMIYLGSSVLIGLGCIRF